MYPGCLPGELDISLVWKTPGELPTQTWRLKKVLFQLAGPLKKQLNFHMASAGSTDYAVGGTAELLEALPGEPWFAYGLEDPGAALSAAIRSAEETGQTGGAPGVAPGAVADQLRSATGLDLEQTLDSIGSLAFYLSGTSEADFRVGFDVAISDPETAARSIDSLSDLAKGQGVKVGPAPSGADDGLTATIEQAKVEVALTGEELTVSATGASAPSESGTLEESDVYTSATEALGEDFEPQTFVGFPDLFAFVESVDPTAAADLETARPYTENLSYAIAGTRTDENRTYSRFVVGVE